MTDDRIILCYHALSDDWPAPTAVVPDDFVGQVEVLARRGYRGVTFSEAMAPATRGKVVAVTFDDAHESVWNHARGPLAHRGWPATVFVPTRFPGTSEPMAWAGNDLWAETPWVGELTCMDWERIGALAQAGWEVGSHTRSHPLLTELEDDELHDELVGSRADVAERVGRPCPTLAYPYGSVDARVAAAAELAGYATAAATLYDPRAATRMTVPRMVVSRADRVRRFALKTAPTLRRVLAHPGLARLKASVQAEGSAA